MQKVSRTMLAVVAAIQSGAHTRRKPKYIKEQALVSHLYPLYSQHTLGVESNVIGGGKFLGEITTLSANHKNDTIDVVANIRQVLFVITAEEDVANYSASAALTLSHRGTTNVDIDMGASEGIDVANYNASAGLTLKQQTINLVDVEMPEQDIANYTATASLIIRVE